MQLIVAALLVSLGAGFVRGFAGFGYSALTVAGLSMLASPAQLVPAVLALEVVASASLLRSSLPQVNRAWLKALLMGNALFVPAGITLLAFLPDNLVRLLLGGSLLLCAGFLRAAGNFRLQSTGTVRAGTGAGSGLLNGLAASGGVLAAMMMAAAGVAATELRATTIVFLLAAGAYTLLWAAALSTGAGASLLNPMTLLWIALLLPTMWIGIWWGRKVFASRTPGNFRNQVLDLLIVISGLGVLRALWSLFGL